MVFPFFRCFIILEGKVIKPLIEGYRLREVESLSGSVLTLVSKEHPNTLNFLFTLE